MPIQCIKLWKSFLGGMLLVVFATSAVAQSPLQKLTDLFAQKEEQPLPPEQAFQLDMKRDANNNMLLRWNISKGYYLYRKKIQVTQAGTKIALDKPSGETITDEFFGTTQVYRMPMDKPVRFVLPQMPAGKIDKAASIGVRYQGCADLGICYPPITQTLALADIPRVSTVSTKFDVSSPQVENTALSEQDQIVDKLAGYSLLMVILAFLGFGVLLGLTPCVLPMIPIVSSLVIGAQGTQGASGSAIRAFMLTTVYVLAMAATYAVFGVIVGLGGANVQVWFQQPAVIIVFATLFVALALSMFGLYELRMPSALQARLGQMGTRQRGHFLGAAVMGSASALIVGPCVTPPLVGALLFIAQTGDAMTGALALFSLGVGMGVPLWVVGTSAGKWLVRPSADMDRINALFGFLLLAVAVWLVDRIIAPIWTQLLGGLLLVFGAIYLYGMHSGVLRFLFLWRSLSFAMLLYGVLLLVGVSAGGSGGFLAPLSPFVQTDEQHKELLFSRVESMADFQTKLAGAVAQKRWSMLDFYADWCVACKELEAFTFSSGKVQQALGSFALMQVDVTDNKLWHQKLLKKFDLYGPPTVLFFNPEGQEYRPARLVGFVSANVFVDHLQKLHSQDVQ